MSCATFRHSMYATIAVVALSGTPTAAAERPVNCAAGQRLSGALRHANPGDILRVSGTCQERVKVTTDRITIDGQGLTVLDGGGGGPLEFSAVVTIDGVQGVVLTGLTVQNGPGEGILGIRGAAFTLSDVTVAHNGVTGIAVGDGSTATLVDCIVRQNRLGLDVFTNSAAVLKGAISITGSAANGVDVTGRSMLELRGAAVHVSENGSFGLTVGGSKLAILGFAESRGSTLTITRNGLAGLVIATGSLEVLASAPEGIGANVITSSHNGTDGVFLPTSGTIVSPFGTAKFVIHGNAVGLNFGNDSNAVIVGGLDVKSNRIGLLADGAGALTLVSVPPNPSSILGNGTDVHLAFGTRAMFDGPAVATIVCDPTVLTQGSTVCP